MRERTPFRASLFARLPKLEHVITSGKRNASIDLDAARERGLALSWRNISPGLQQAARLLGLESILGVAS